LNLSEEQILALAPDESSRKAGKDLANASKWSNTGMNEKALWGECQGSGKNPYKTQVDLSSIAFKCSCPSRKFPCKHGLGVMLLYTRQKQLFAPTDYPAWVKEWIEKREEKAEKKQEKVDKPVDVEAQNKRIQQRQKKVEGGIEELQLVLKDIVRNGILGLPEKAPALFDNLSKRMVDSQAPGLAFMVKELAGINYYKEKWHTELLDQVVKIHVATSAFQQEDQLPDLWQEELKSILGFPQNTDELKQQGGHSGHWFVLARQTDQREQLQVQKNWLLELTSGKFALVIQYYVRSQMPEVNFTPGTTIEAELCFYKSVRPYRAIVKSTGKIVLTETLNNGFNSWNSLFEYEKEQIILSPFVSEECSLVNQLTLVVSNEQWFMCDENGVSVALLTDRSQRLKILAVTGGKKFSAVVLGQEGKYIPMAIIINNSYIGLS
jgi:hypothetical protein